MQENISLDEALKKCGACGGPVSGHALEEIVRKVFADEAEAVETIRSGKDKKGAKVKFLQGLVMKETRGSADASETASIIQSLLK